MFIVKMVVMFIYWKEINYGIYFRYVIFVGILGY